jgi:hypothetical protein
MLGSTHFEATTDAREMGLNGLRGPAMPTLSWSPKNSPGSVHFNRTSFFVSTNEPALMRLR